MAVKLSSTPSHCYPYTAAAVGTSNLFSNKDRTQKCNGGGVGLCRLLALACQSICSLAMATSRSRCPPSARLFQGTATTRRCCESKRHNPQGLASCHHLSTKHGRSGRSRDRGGSLYPSSHHPPDTAPSAITLTHNLCWINKLCCQWETGRHRGQQMSHAMSLSHLLYDLQNFNLFFQGPTSS